MKRIFLTTLLMLTVLPAGAGVAGGNKDDAKGKVEQELIELDREFAKAGVGKRDVAAFDRILASDMVMVTALGTIFDKEQIMYHAKSATVWADAINVDEIVVRSYSDRAVVFDHGRATGRRGSTPYDDEFRGTRVFLKRDGRWQMVASQVTHVLPRKK